MVATTNQPRPKRETDATTRCPVKLLRRIGSTTYEVTVHYSNTRKTTMADIIRRVLEREVDNGAR